MTPRAVPEPLESPLQLLVFVLAAVASFFAAGWALASYLFDRFTGGS